MDKAANGYMDAAADQMQDIGFPAQERPSSGGQYQEETAGYRIPGTVALIALDLVEMAGLYNLDLASLEDQEVAAARHGQGTTLLEVTLDVAGVLHGWASVGFLGLNVDVPFELELSLRETLGLQSQGSVEEHQGDLAGFPG